MKRITAILAALALALPWNAMSQEASGSRKAVATSTDICVVALPVATLAGVLIAKDWKGLAEGAITAGATAAATLILKYSIKELRPDGSNTHSFPSGHTSVSFATATFLQKRYGWKFGVPAYAVAGYVAWGRVFARKHHWWDAAAGALIGAGCAFVFTTPFARDHELSITPMADCCYTGVSAQLTF